MCANFQVCIFGTFHREHFKCSDVALFIALGTLFVLLIGTSASIIEGLFPAAHPQDAQGWYSNARGNY